MTDRPTGNPDAVARTGGDDLDAYLRTTWTNPPGDVTRGSSVARPASLPPVINPVTTGDTRVASAPGQKFLPGLLVEDPNDKPGSQIKVDIGGPEDRAYTTNAASIARIRGWNTEKRQASTGTGFFVNEEGLLVTDYHVVRNASDLIVVTSDGKRYSATVAKVFEEKDLAALQLQIVDGTKTTPVKLPTRPVVIEPGTRVAALGHPDGHYQIHISPGKYVAAGKLSEENINGGLLPKEDPQRAIHRMSMDTRPASSGSLVVNLVNGEVLGIQGMSNSGGRTIVTPAQDVRALVDAVMAGRGQTIAFPPAANTGFGKNPGIYFDTSRFTIDGGNQNSNPFVISPPGEPVKQPTPVAPVVPSTSVPVVPTNRQNPFRIGG